MTKKQRHEIAKIWAGSILLNVGMDSFGNDVSYEDAGTIVEMVHDIGRNILKDRADMSDLEKIIEQALAPKVKLTRLFAEADQACENIKELFKGMKGRKICSDCGIDYNEKEVHKCL